MIDIETYSRADLIRVGLYRYVDDPTFTILLFSYKLNDEDVVTYDLTKENLPEKIINAIKSPKIIKEAWNAQF